MRVVMLGTVLLCSVVGVPAAQQAAPAFLGSATEGMWLIREVNRATGEYYGTLPAALVADVRRRLAGRADFAVFSMATKAVSLGAATDGRPQLSAAEVTPGALRMVGVPPVLGREFTDDDVRSGRRVVVISYAVWQGLFGGRADVIGSPLPAREGRSVPEIIGVLPRDFFQRVPVADPDAEVFIPSADFIDSAATVGRLFPPVVRLRATTTLAEARLTLETSVAVAAAQRQLADYPAALTARLDPADRPGWRK
jgi:hypothetical protein